MTISNISFKGIFKSSNMLPPMIDCKRKAVLENLNNAAKQFNDNTDLVLLEGNKLVPSITVKGREYNTANLKKTEPIDFSQTREEIAKAINNFLKSNNKKEI
jgi:molybdopterin-guanine dinucleotide biosynthesis protein